MYNFLIFIVVISISVLAHEGGHYCLARLTQTDVDEFSIGIGPTILCYRGKMTVWSIRLLPFGGFVRLKGEKSNDVEMSNGENGSFAHKNAYQRLSIIIAGAFINILLAFILMSSVLFFNGVADTDSTVVGGVIAESPAAKIQLRNGDVILSIDNQKTTKWFDISLILNAEKRKNQRDYRICIKRDDETLSKIALIVPNKEGRKYLGIQPVIRSHSLYDATIYSCNYLINMTNGIIKGFIALFSGNAKQANFVGPVGIANLVGNAMKQGMWVFISFLAVINLHLGLLNLLPIPALDGGRALFILIEIIFGSKLADKTENTIHFIGFILLFVLMIFITFSDIFSIIH